MLLRGRRQEIVSERLCVGNSYACHVVPPLFHFQPGEDLGIDLAPGAVEQTDDPVRIYLREMGVVPLLTREGEVDIAKRIERGQRRVLKALSRSPIVIREVLAIGEDLKRGVRSIKEIVVFDEEEITEKVLQNRVKDTTHRIDELQKHYKRASQLAVRLQTIPAKKKARECLWYAEIQSRWHKQRRSRAFRSNRSFRNGYVRWTSFRFFRERFASTIRSACFDFELLF